ncbi:MAG: hypothetical protein HY052_02625 [Proteobacteria bacterium]|nr:hypothetical protein [Pseudomonadota bacterium]
MTTEPTIFVQIASYRDPECPWTIKDLFAKAEHPERVRVGICEQCFPDQDQNCLVETTDHIRVISVLPSESLGVCWARAKTQTLFQDEDYVLMIDSHMRFVQGWDSALIAELARCTSPKSFLSAYPASYKPPDHLEQNPRPVVLRAKPFTAAGDIRFEGETLADPLPEKPLRGAFLAAGFIFAPGRFVREVPYDPHLYFDHEEVTIAARAYTHGWDVFSPPGAFVYHYYYEPHKGETRALHWSDHRDWGKFQLASRARYNYLLAGIVPKEHPASLLEIDKYGLGTVRTIEEFEKFTGVDFKEKIVSERALTAGFVEGIIRHRPPGERFLKVGDVMPSLKEKEFEEERCFFCVMPSAFNVYVQEFSELYDAKREEFQSLGCRLVFIAPVPDICTALGIASKVHDTPFSYLLDARRKIIGLYNNRNAGNHIHDLLRAARGQ